MPIVVLMALSFNASKSKASWGGFTFDWYKSMFSDGLIMDALTNTLSIAFISALVAAVIGTAAAIGIHAMREREYNLNMINKFATVAKEFDLATNVHPHVGTYFMYEDEIDFVMENTDPKLVHFAPDTAHIAAAGANAVEVIKRYADRVNFTHLKDYRLGDEVTSEGWVDSGVPIMDCFHGLGMGTIDFPAIFKILDEVGYTGPLCAELDKTPTTHKDSAKKNYDYLSKYLED